jgi:hypothetical protein
MLGGHAKRQRRGLEVALGAKHATIGEGIVCYLFVTVV